MHCTELELDQTRFTLISYMNYRDFPFIFAEVSIHTYIGSVIHSIGSVIINSESFEEEQTKTNHIFGICIKKCKFKNISGGTFDAKLK